MATAINSPARDTSARRGEDIKLEYGQPEIVAFKFVTGKNIEGRYGPRVLFTTTGDDKLWLDAEDGSDLERGMRDLCVRPGHPVRITKIKVHGGGHSIRVELAEETRLESDLRQSIANAEETKRVTAQRARTATAAPTERTAASTPDDSQKKELVPANTQSNSPTISPAGAKYMGAYQAAIDILLESQVYAKRHGLLLEIKCEDVRCLAATLIIQNGKAA